jgi:hypothetical protein
MQIKAPTHTCTYTIQVMSQTKRSLDGLVEQQNNQKRQKTESWMVKNTALSSDNQYPITMESIFQLGRTMTRDGLELLLPSKGVRYFNLAKADETSTGPIGRRVRKARKSQVLHDLTKTRHGPHQPRTVCASCSSAAGLEMDRASFVPLYQCRRCYTPKSMTVNLREKVIEACLQSPTCLFDESLLVCMMEYLFIPKHEKIEHGIRTDECEDESQVL